MGRSVNGEAAAFQVGRYSPSILSVRKVHRHSGLATALVEASVARAWADNVNVLSVHCSPETSLGFWKRVGFVPFTDSDRPGDLLARRTLERTFLLSPLLSLTKVVIGFYPEAAVYTGGKGVPAIAEHVVDGVRKNDGSIILRHRVIGLADDEPEGRDLVVKIQSADRTYCFCKAKYREAESVGVQQDALSNAFFIDRLRLKGT